MFKTKERIIQVRGLQKKDLLEMEKFLQGLVYTFCKQRGSEKFFLRDLLGGENFYWQGTPMFLLYKRQLDTGKSKQEAFRQAAKDAGKILKIVLDKDKREFILHNGWRLSYEWTLVEKNEE